jgi:hypothetical protein
MKTHINLTYLDETTVEVRAHGINGIAHCIDKGGTVDGKGEAPKWELSPNVRHYDKEINPLLQRDADL